MPSSSPLDLAWTASSADLERSRTAEFMRAHGIDTFGELVRKSQDDIEWFWREAVDYLGIPFSRPFERVLDTDDGIPYARWFEGGTLNMSEACVDRWAAQSPDRIAVVAENEIGESLSLTFWELLDRVGRAAAAITELGVGRGDTVAVYLPMIPEAVISMLAIARVGAIFVPVFSGYAEGAVADRLESSRAALLITADGYTRRGRPVNMKETADLALAIAGVSIPVLVVASAGRSDAPLTEGRDHGWTELLGALDPIPAAPVDSEDPVLLAYTSGTTGRPKGVVHAHGGLTVKLIEEGAFQLELGQDDRLMWLTDMGWIMGPWMVVAGLGNGASIGLYDGAPDFPDPGRVWRTVAGLGITALGVSPTLIRALQPHGSDLAHQADLSALRAFASTGEPWNPDPWWWLFRDVGGERRPILNISGGTEVGACFLSANIVQGIKPVSVGGPSLGLAIDVFDADGRPLRDGVGELVCTKPWPAMTRGFWGDDDRYLATYWDRWDDVWVHGDWASIDSDGFWFLHGRSDDTMNIAGKRLGPAEIESVVVAHPDVVMAAAVPIPDDVKGEAIAIFVVPVTGIDGSGELAADLEARIVAALGKSFKPSAIRFVTDLPRTRSAKIMRRVVRARALGEDTGDLGGLENPDAVDGIPRL
jgi:acetyl-CoA synthetase